MRQRERERGPEIERRKKHECYANNIEDVYIRRRVCHANAAPRHTPIGGAVQQIRDENIWHRRYTLFARNSLCVSKRERERKMRE